MFTTYEQVRQKVIKDYFAEDTALGASFFDFEVRMSKGELMRVYADLQEEINGDIVTIIDKPVVVRKFNGDITIFGFEKEIDDCFLHDIYEGNMKDFLESFNEREQETGWCRIMDFDDNYKGTSMVGGTKLLFIC